MFILTTNYQNDKYENFFLHLKVTPEALATLGDFTATAVAGSAGPPLFAT